MDWKSQSHLAVDITRNLSIEHCGVVSLRSKYARNRKEHWDLCNFVVKSQYAIDLNLTATTKSAKQVQGKLDFERKRQAFQKRLTKCGCHKKGQPCSDLCSYIECGNEFGH